MQRMTFIAAVTAGVFSSVFAGGGFGGNVTGGAGGPVVTVTTAQELLAYAEAAVDQPYVIEVQGTAEAKPFSKETLDTVLALAEKGIKQLFQAQQTAIDQLKAK